MAPDPSVRSSLLRRLPNLYKDYILALHKQRSSLFSGTPTGQQTSERIRVAALRFGDECLVRLKRMGREELQESIWQTMVDVLQVTEQEALFDLAEKDHIIRMEEVGEDALKHLDHAWDGGLMLSIAFLSLKGLFLFVRFTISFSNTCTGRTLLHSAYTSRAQCPVSSTYFGTYRYGKSACFASTCS